MAAQTQGPDVYEFSFDETRITFMPRAHGTRADGTLPRVVYSGPLGEHRFDGSDVLLFESPRGLEVSVKLDSHLQTVTLTVFVPELALDDVRERSFRTVGIHTTQRRTIAGGPGAHMTAKPLELDGLARGLEAAGPALL